jgi:hypothetical protein
MESIQMRPAKVHAVLAGATETVGGSLFAAGLATPLASAALTGVMTTAIRKVHLPNGLWAANGGCEYSAVLIAAVAALAETGPGDLSLNLDPPLILVGPGSTGSDLDFLGERGEVAGLSGSSDEPFPVTIWRAC